MAVKAVWILTAGFGEGHNAAARNLAAALRVALPDARVEVEDLFLEAYGPLNRLAQRLYLWAINRLPWVWDRVYRWLDRSSAVRDRIGIFGRAAQMARAKLSEFSPDVVVTTYPGYNHLLDHLHARGERPPYVQVTVVTDSITVNSVWLTGHSDYWIAANDATAERIRACGIAADRVLVFGFPVPAVFEELVPVSAPPGAGEKWKVLFMVNTGKQIALEAIRSLSRLDGIELSVTVGRDEPLRRRVEAAAEESGGRIEVLGWTDRMPELMADSHVVISKAGGATVQECLAACTPMIVSQVVPGQEEGNARLVVEAGAGVVATDPQAIVRALDNAFADGGAVWRRWRKSAGALARPDAAGRLAGWIAGLR